MDEKNPCNICPRRCNVSRDGRVGFCGVPAEIHVSRVSLHKWEEPPVSGKNGSGTIFFTGCNLRCVFCQNKRISGSSDLLSGAVSMTPEELCDAMLRLQDEGAHNVNLVTPTHYSEGIIKALQIAKPRLSIPVVYNSSGYESVDTLKRLSGLVDVYLPDLKYFSSELSAKYSGAADYFEVASRALTEMLSQVGEAMFEDGLIKRGVIVRHLVLPGCRKDSIKVLEALSELMPTDKIKLSLMRQFTPDFVDKDRYPELRRRVTTFEYDSVVRRAGELGFDGYIQSAESATSEYTPSFNCAEAFLIEKQRVL